MIEKSYSLYTYVRKDPRSKKTHGFVYVRVTVDGVSKDFSTHQRWRKERWDDAAERAVGTKEDARTLNAYLDTLDLKASEARRRLVDDNKPITAEGLVQVLQGNSDDRKYTLKLFKEHNDQMAKLIEVGEYAKGTQKKYDYTYNHTEAFIKYKYKKDDLELRELNYEFIEAFYNYLRTVKECAKNTTMKYLANFKKIVLNAYKKGFIHRDPFFGYKLTRKDPPKIALNRTELSAIENKVFSTARLTQIRDYFVFSCYTGLAYIDIKQLRRTDIVIGDDGKKWIMLSRQKTDAPIRLPLLPVALALVEKYWENEYCIEHNLVFPIPSNQKVNEYLKEIADLCGIIKTLTFHLARHTFATTVTLKNGVPMETVRILLAHASIKETERYAVVDEEKVREDMERLAARLDPDDYQQALRAIGDTAGMPMNVVMINVIQKVVEITMARVEEKLKAA